ncbi:MAG: acetyl-CoA carboxylase carboxyltransferase subunit beta [Eubacterium sp.]
MNPFFKKQRDKIFKLKALREGQSTPGPLPVSETQPLGITCPTCGHTTTLDILKKQDQVCRCGYHYPLDAHTRLQITLDPGTFHDIGRHVRPFDWLGFPGYAQKLKSVQNTTGLTRFLMGSMGSAVGEKITLATELATKKKLPLIIFCASGGARMQEGILSLMQMAKTSAALKRFSDRGGLYISVLTHPTTGGVTASFAMLGDITLAEPEALIGFAGPRVIEQTIGETLPQGFQRSEFQEDHGFVDAVVERREMRDTLLRILRLHDLKGGTDR